MRGRKPTPIEIRKIQGTYKAGTWGGRAESNDVATEATCPEHVTGIARDEWNNLHPQLVGMRVLTRSDLNSLTIYCVAYGRWRDAEARVAEEGAVVASPTGFPMENPYLKIANKAVEQMHKFGNELGLTPVSRARIKVPDAASEEDEVDKVLKIAG